MDPRVIELLQETLKFNLDKFSPGHHTAEGMPSCRPSDIWFGVVVHPANMSVFLQEQGDEEVVKTELDKILKDRGWRLEGSVYVLHTPSAE